MTPGAVTQDEIIDGIIEREGGYSDRAEDSGGPTKFGIKLATTFREAHGE